ncbi:hypothetical protein EJ04DRAFT_508658 [Polyplosphaeria fusca]|uniref:Uncharacterized protein n=1 Tax=Polyplosphaeria fusca TaxID=682080 RepID=A0A9P4R9W2_9PLEO|nr:hypothetical protein EJ04DRAFT_508658 [Polyplosphaeria fusca]
MSDIWTLYPAIGDHVRYVDDTHSGVRTYEWARQTYSNQGEEVASKWNWSEDFKDYYTTQEDKYGGRIRYQWARQLLSTDYQPDPHRWIWKPEQRDYYRVVPPELFFKERFQIEWGRQQLPVLERYYFLPSSKFRTCAEPLLPVRISLAKVLSATHCQVFLRRHARITDEPIPGLYHRG